MKNQLKTLTVAIMIMAGFLTSCSVSSDIAVPEEPIFLNDIPTDTVYVEMHDQFFADIGFGSGFMIAGEKTLRADDYGLITKHLNGPDYPSGERILLVNDYNVYLYAFKNPVYTITNVDSTYNTNSMDSTITLDSIPNITNICETFNIAYDTAIMVNDTSFMVDSIGNLILDGMGSPIVDTIIPVETNVIMHKDSTFCQDDTSFIYTYNKEYTYFDSSHHAFKHDTTEQVFTPSQMWHKKADKDQPFDTFTELANGIINCNNDTAIRYLMPGYPISMDTTGSANNGDPAFAIDGTTDEITSVYTEEQRWLLQLVIESPTSETITIPSIKVKGILSNSQQAQLAQKYIGTEFIDEFGTKVTYAEGNFHNNLVIIVKE